METKKIDRFKSPVLWEAIVAQVLSILLLTGVIDVGQSEWITSVAAGVLQLLVLLGVVNNPTDKTNW